MTISQRVKTGLGAWRSAACTLKSRPSIRHFVAVPLVVYGILLVLLLYLSLSQIQPALLSWMAGESSEGFLFSVWKLLSYLAAVIVWALLVVPTYAISNLLMSPLHSFAAERILTAGGMTLPVVQGAGPWVKFFLRSLSVGLLKSALLILISIPLFLGGFIPGVGLFFVYLSFVILSFDCTDYSLEVMDLSLAERFQYLRRYRWEYAGFGIVFFLASFIPLAMLIVLPVGIVAGAHLVLELSGKQDN